MNLDHDRKLRRLVGLQTADEQFRSTLVDTLNGDEPTLTVSAQTERRLRLERSLADVEARLTRRALLIARLQSSRRPLIASA